jgi:hypothetical protein
MKQQKQETILDRISSDRELLGYVIEGMKTPYQRYLAKLIIDSVEVVARRELPWEYKSLIHYGEEDFCRGGSFRVMYGLEGENRLAWHREAAKALGEEVCRSVLFEEDEGLILFVRDGTKFRPGRPGDSSYDFVRRLSADGNLSDISIDTPPSWGEELFVNKHNLDAYAYAWYDASHLSDPKRLEKKRVRREAVWRETLRLMGCEPYASSQLPPPSEWGDEISETTAGNSAASPPTSALSEKPLSAKERTNLLALVGALLELVQSPRNGRDTDAAVIRELLDNYSEKPGISQRNLEAKFPEAKRVLRGA